MSSFVPREVFQSDRCTGCGVCSSLCPVSSVITGGGGLVQGFSRTCIGCGHCGAYCPSNCFGLEPVEDSTEIPSEDSIQQLYALRRSTRAYSSRGVEETVLHSLLQPLDYSPSGHNDGNITVTVVNGRENVRKRISEPVIRLIRILDCFGLLTLLSGPFSGTVRKLRAGEDLIAWNAPCVILLKAPLKNVTGSADCVIAATMISLKAEAMGMGTLWNGFIRILAPLLGLGRASAVLCAGYPSLRKLWKVPPRDWKIKP